jgi:hypothetical protein
MVRNVQRVADRLMDAFANGVCLRVLDCGRNQLDAVIYFDYYHALSVTSGAASPTQNRQRCCSQRPSIDTFET